ncbi:MAG: universal stress protein [Dehalobacterium sp.]
MYKKVLLTTDGSDNSLKAVDNVTQLIKNYGSEVMVLYVGYSPLGYFHSDMPNLHPNIEWEEVMAKCNQKTINRMVNKLKLANIEAKPITKMGDPADMICQVAEEEDIDLIVIASRGLSPAKRFISGQLGSVSTKVVNHAPCPVLVVR